ncbi:related to Exocyst complex component Sec3 [Pseudozyma flocculosa]|uniref:Related to Exocyst complex component Sec3 n=1 Tax=Pseudozyma flocculosa TaxID=84751 RepID=A0A5C3F5T6_9BASI|nr:related to Exocyst complex component Sec3 [Pseudozyma flocculosa]
MSTPSSSQRNGLLAPGAGAAGGSNGTTNPAGGSNSPSKTKELFNAALQSRDAANNYIAHIKIWEDVASEDPSAGTGASASQKKARYLILAVQKDTGKVTINKAKRNANGSFSIGKDWDLNTLREVTVHDPDVFSITLTRPYKWQTQHPREQLMFLQTLVKVYRKYTGDNGPKLVGIDVPLSSGSSLSNSSRGRDASPAPPAPTQTTPVAIPSRRPENGAKMSSSSSSPALSPHNLPAPSLNLPMSASPTRGADASSRHTHSPSKSSILSARSRSESQSSFDKPRPAKLSESSSTNALSSSVSPPTLDSPSRTMPPPRPSARRLVSADSLSVPTPPPARRQNSGDSVRSASSGGSSGDARARLSAVGPMRGGAAYERMLLAGTGLSGVAEADDDEDGQDPYGGAVLGDGEAAASETTIQAKRATLGRPKAARLDSSEHARSQASANFDDDEDEDSTLQAVEEMLEGFEWRGIGARHFPDSGLAPATGKGTADVIEARLLDELSALESANIHAIIESDDRVALVVQHMEEALAHLDMMDSMIAGFKVQLNSRADDISHIESQNRGLQVQTSNQRTLMAEIDNLINTINVDDSALHTLSAGRLENDEGIAQLESAAASLYKSMLQAKRDGDSNGGDMAAATERLAEHESVSNRFCKRVMDYLNVTFNVEAQRLLSDPARQKALAPPLPTLRDHASMEDALGRYCGILLYMKEVSPQNFSRVSASYFASASECYKTEMQKLFAVYKSQIKQASDEDMHEASFAPAATTSVAASAIRSGTIRRTGRDKNKLGRGRNDISASEAFQRALSNVIPIVLREQGFIADLLHVNDNNITFADYMDLEPYFRRRAQGVFGVSSTGGPLREMKGALDLIFGFLAPELQSFTDAALAKEKISIFGLLAALDRAMIEAEELNSESILKILSKLQMRLASQLERFIQDQIKGIEQTKLTVKKRKGIVHFIKVFPTFVDRVESQLINAETLNVRHAVDGHYDAICRAMFDALQTISRVDGGGVDEDKGQLNHHIILIENMWYFNANISKQRNAALNALVKRAEKIYGDSLESYRTSVLRRPLGKMMDFGDGIDALLRSTPATEVSLHSTYSKSALKRLVKEYGAKDVRKSIEALSKRVQKHFGTDDDDLAEHHDRGDEIEEVLARVWASCEDGFVREVDRLARIVRDCYKDASVGLEVGSADVRRLFAGCAPSGRRK